MAIRYGIMVKTNDGRSIYPYIKTADLVGQTIDTTFFLSLFPEHTPVRFEIKRNPTKLIIEAVESIQDDG